MVFLWGNANKSVVLGELKCLVFPANSGEMLGWILGVDLGLGLEFLDQFQGFVAKNILITLQ